MPNTLTVEISPAWVTFPDAPIAVGPMSNGRDALLRKNTLRMEYETSSDRKTAIEFAQRFVDALAKESNTHLDWKITADDMPEGRRGYRHAVSSVALSAPITEVAIQKARVIPEAARRSRHLQAALRHFNTARRFTGDGVIDNQWCYFHLYKAVEALQKGVQLEEGESSGNSRDDKRDKKRAKLGQMAGRDRQFIEDVMATAHRFRHDETDGSRDERADEKHRSEGKPVGHIIDQDACVQRVRAIIDGYAAEVLKRAPARRGRKRTGPQPSP